MRKASSSPSLATTIVCLFLFLSVGNVTRADDDARLHESLPEGAEVVALEVFPAEIDLDRRHSYRQLLVTGRLASGERADLTRLVEVEGPTDLVEITSNRRVIARRDGASEITIRFGKHESRVPVTVSRQKEPFHPDFVQDVQPILSRVGCNQGTCHGSQAGKNGFKLSLRGNDYLFDHRALTDDHGGRRFNRAAPERSLFLLKITGGIPHVGGVLVDESDDYYKTLLGWVRDGVPLDLEVPRVESIEILPKEPVVPLPGMRQQMVVVARYEDGSVRDVTAETFIETNDTEVTDVDRNGVVTAVRRGECAILARYEGRYAATRLIIMGDRSGWEWQETEEHNWIDTLVYEKLRKVKSLPSDVCTDEEFIRRVYLDLTGLPPTSKEVRIFALDGRDSRQKREELVDRLIGGAEFVEHYTNKWSDLLQVNPKWLGRDGAHALREWIRRSVASNEPYDRFVREIITASGSTVENPPAAYYKVLRNPDAVMENTTQLFLGIRFNCNQCHDHPFERWTQRNYWELASFFSQVSRKDAPNSPKMPRLSATQTEVPAFEEIIGDESVAEVKYPTGEPAPPRFPYEFDGGSAVAVSASDEGRTRREMLASWLTSKENPYFARSFVNRLWSYFLGVGLIDPVDDIRAGNPPTNPELLDRLTDEFVRSGFDVRHIIRLICTSRTYSHSIQTNRWNEDDQINFSHAIARRLPAETLFDAIHRVTGSTPKLPGLRAGARAAEADPTVKLEDGFLDLFGRPPRESACECERSSGMSLGQALNLVNGPTVAEAVRDPRNAITALVEVERSSKAIIEEVFLSVLNRMPNEAELAQLAPTLDAFDPENADALPPEFAAELEKRRVAWEEANQPSHWETITPVHAGAESEATLTVLDDGSILAGGTIPETDRYTVIASTDLSGITGLRIEALPHESLPQGGPGRADNGNLVLSEMRVLAASRANPSVARPLVLQNASHDFAQDNYPSAFVIDGKSDDRKGWALAGSLGKPHYATFEVAEDAGFEGGTILIVSLDQQFGGKHTLGRFRISVTRSPRPVRVSSFPQAVVDALLTPPEERSPEARAAIYRQYLRSDREMQERLRLHTTQDLVWALLNSPAFLFNR